MSNNIFTIKVDGKERDIKMTFGLLNTLCRRVGDIDGASQMTIDQVLRDVVLVELLSDRDKNGKIIAEVDIDTLDLDLDELINLLDWAGEHVLDFFLKGLEKTKSLQDRNMNRIKALMPSSNGSAS